MNYSDVVACCTADKTPFGSDMTVHAVHYVPDLSGNIKPFVDEAEIDM